MCVPNLVRAAPRASPDVEFRGIDVTVPVPGPSSRSLDRSEFQFVGSLLLRTGGRGGTRPETPVVGRPEDGLCTISNSIDCNAKQNANQDQGSLCRNSV